MKLVRAGLRRVIQVGACGPTIFAGVAVKNYGRFLKFVGTERHVARAGVSQVVGGIVVVRAIYGEKV